MSSLKAEEMNSLIEENAWLRNQVQRYESLVRAIWRSTSDLVELSEQFVPDNAISTAKVIKL